MFFYFFYFCTYSEYVEFVFYGKSNSIFNCWAICEVVGGPDYKIALTGEASIVSYALDRSFLDFGQILFNVIFFTPSLYCLY